MISSSDEKKMTPTIVGVEGQGQGAEGVGGDRREGDQDRDREHHAKLTPAVVAGCGEDGNAADHGDRHRQEQGDV
jgi:hypothetical protein